MFVFIFVFIFVLLLVLFLTPVGFYLYWRYKRSIEVVGTSEVAVRMRFAKLEDTVYPTGPVFVPHIPLKFGGKYPYALFRVSKEQLVITYKGEAEDKLFTKDGKPITRWEATVLLILPHCQSELLAIKKMANSNLKLSGDAKQIAEGLKPLLEDSIVPALGDAISKTDYDDIWKRKRLVAESDAATTTLRAELKGVLQRTGIAGSDPTDVTEGTGYIRLIIEYAYNEGMASTAEKAGSAAATADAEAILIGGPITRMLDQWVEQQAEHSGLVRDPVTKKFNVDELAKLTKRLKARGAYGEKEKFFERLRMIADPDYKYQEGVIDVTSGGQPLSGSLQYLSVGGGGGAGVLVGGGKGGNGPRDSKKGKPWQRSKEERLSDWEQMKKERLEADSKTP